MLGQVPVCKNQVIHNFPEVVHVGECLVTLFSVSRVFKLSPVSSSNYVSEVYILKKCSDTFSEKKSNSSEIKQGIAIESTKHYCTYYCTSIIVLTIIF